MQEPSYIIFGGDLLSNREGRKKLPFEQALPVFDKEGIFVIATTPERQADL